MPRKTLVIGIDAAVSAKRTGIVLGEFAANASITTVVNPSAEAVAGLFSSRGDNSDERVLLCIDAPLGWPVALADALQQHTAGSVISTQSNMLFRRQTDRWIKSNVGQQPLDVGADRIARTAHAALAFLYAVRTISGRAIPLAWSPEFEEPSACIEVYPAATLRSYRLPSAGYKDDTEPCLLRRAEILDGLDAAIQVTDSVRKAALASDHVFDATLCAVAGFNFLRGESCAPVDETLARREGWIWVKAPQA